MTQEDVRCIDFTKMSGAGNDFVVMDNRKRIVSDPSTFARVVCDRRKGIGADGLLLIEESSKADFLMKYFNSDGSYGGMCGNGGRCISRFAYLKQIVPGPELSFEALEHIYTASVSEKMVTLRMKEPADFRINQELRISDLSIRFHFVNSGSPHCVIFLEENKDLPKQLEEVDVDGLGRKIRNHDFFSPEGANINFVDNNSSNIYFTRTYERGVEEETLACGTGSVAVALIANRVKNSPSPITLGVRSGEFLSVEFKKTGIGLYQEVCLTGSAHMIFSGVIKYEYSTQSIVDIL
jgi:diaminopimelate epimerase